MQVFVSKGGNLALNLAPQPDGRLPGRALRELAVLSDWMKIFSPAIHKTRAIAPYREGKYAYTRNKEYTKVNVFYLYNEDTAVPTKYEFKLPYTVKKVVDMRSGKTLDFSVSSDIVTVVLPDELSSRAPDIADCFVIDVE